MKTYNVGFVGFGAIAKVHAYGYLNLPLYYDPAPLKARITHVVTSRMETAEKGRLTVGADVAATDYHTVTENPEIDIVHICTPNHLHKDALLSAIANGKHIYCDKPLVATADEADEILAALAGYRGTAQMTFQYRFYPATQRAKRLIKEGALGRLLSFRAVFLHSGSVDPSVPAKWKLTRAGGGGVIADLASHVIDLADFLFGPFRSVMAATSIAYPQRPAMDDPSRQVTIDAEDTVAMLVRTRSGALGTLEATKLATGIDDELRLEVHGTKGAIRFNGIDPHHFEFHDALAPDAPLGGLCGWNRISTGQRYEPPASGFPNLKSSIGWIRSHAACLANFLCAVAEGRPAQPSLEQGIRIQRIMEAIRQSAREDRWVDCPE